MRYVKIGNRYYDEPSLPPPSVAVRTAPRKEDRSCRCSEVDEYGRAVFIGWCSPQCEGRPLRGRHRRRA